MFRGSGIPGKLGEFHFAEFVSTLYKDEELFIHSVQLVISIADEMNE